MLQSAAAARQLLRHIGYAACLNDFYRCIGFIAHYCGTDTCPICGVGCCNFTLCVDIYEPMRYINNHNKKFKSGLSFLFKLTTFFSFICSRVSNVGWVWVTGWGNGEKISTVRHLNTDIKLCGPSGWHSCFIFTKTRVQVLVIIYPGK